jgi:hypothetical protein
MHAVIHAADIQDRDGRVLVMAGLSQDASLQGWLAKPPAQSRRMGK